MDEDITSCKVVDPCGLHKSAQETNNTSSMQKATYQFKKTLQVVNEPPNKRRIQSDQISEELQLTTAKALEIVVGKTPEICKIDRLKQTVSKNPKAHFYRKKYDLVFSNI